jgi:hypothetical protein
MFIFGFMGKSCRVPGKPPLKVVQRKSKDLALQRIGFSSPTIEGKVLSVTSPLMCQDPSYKVFSK